MFGFAREEDANELGILRAALLLEPVGQNGARIVIGRTALECGKEDSLLHPRGIFTHGASQHNAGRPHAFRCAADELDRR